MKRTFTLSTLLTVILFGTVATAQTVEIGPYVFTKKSEVKHTDVRDQNRSGTCWAFAGVGLIEAEIMRLDGEAIDISDMWLVRNAYYEKTIKYVRMHGEINISEGGNAHDVFMITEKYGLVPEAIYPGNMYGTDGHVHAELAEVLTSFANAIVSNPNRELSTAWKSALNNILDAYFGVIPEEFEYNGKQYNPISFRNEVGIIPTDYVSITSYNHHPFYTSFAIEIPDNWAWGLSYNVPMAELTQIPISALTNGYAVAWDSDVSEKGFKHSKGLALHPNTNVKSMEGSERARWEKLNPKGSPKSIYDFDVVVIEKESNQESRQISFDNYNTTDDHLMLFTGLYADQNGQDFFKVKNSWNTENSVGKGYFWASEAFYNANTISITLHKNAIPNKIKKELKLN